MVYSSSPLMRAGSVRTLLLWLILTAGIWQPMHATHTMGADMHYACLGGGQYMVTLQLFRDCGGVVPLTTQVLNYTSQSCGVSGAINLNQPGSAVDVTPICPSAQSSCSGGGQYGVEMYIYQGVLSLPPGCGTDWVLTWERCCRNQAINTLITPNFQGIFLRVTLDNTLGACNNSPIFTQIPTPIVCVNQPVVYNHGVTDPDGDSLVYSLTDCLQENGQPVAYSGGYTLSNLLITQNGINIDPQSGTITFTPTQVMVGVVCVKVEEYRNGQKIGETTRDLQMIITSCNNSPPVATGTDTTYNTYSANVCLGEQLCFGIDITDANADNISVIWSQNLPGANLTINQNNTSTP